jgi:hypothetical protein
LRKKHPRPHFCYEAGPAGYGFYRQIIALATAATSLRPR